MTNPTVPCYGVSWDATNVLCAGGNDPAYVHPQNGSNRRERCKYFSTCATETNRRKAAAAAPAAPQQNLIPSLPQVPSVPTAPMVVAPPQQQIWQNTSAPRPPAPPVLPPNMSPQGTWQGMTGPQMVPPSWAGLPAFVPMNVPGLGMQIPSYLTVPEPYNVDVPWYWRLAHNLLRAMGKAGCHTAANFFDHSTVTPYEAPKAG